MAEKWQITLYASILWFLSVLKSPFSLHSSAGKLYSLIIAQRVLDWGHYELSLELNRKFLLLILAEKWQTKSKSGILGFIPALRGDLNSLSVLRFSAGILRSRIISQPVPDSGHFELILKTNM